MEKESGIAIEELRVDGGPTKNSYLMQFQSDMVQIPVQVPSAEELSGIRTAYAAGLSAGTIVQWSQQKEIYSIHVKTGKRTKVQWMERSYV